MNSEEMNEITRILTGEASVEEREHFYESLKTDQVKKRVYDTMEKEWVTAGDAMLYKRLDADQAWKRQKEEFLGYSTNNKRSPYGIVFRWAAIIVLAVGLAFYFTMDRIAPMKHGASYATGASETLPIVMDDGTMVTLNQHSSLNYVEKDDSRMVNFSGEAYFEVASNPDKPFIIEMENAYIKVIGTAFNLKANGSSIDVMVNEGIVEFGPIDRSDKTLVTAGSVGKLIGNQLTNNKFTEPNSVSWYTKKLVFEQTPLTVVLSDISLAYQVKFRYDDNTIRDCHLTADFSNEELSDVLETLHTIFQVEFKKRENAYIVSGSTCQQD